MSHLLSLHVSDAFEQLVPYEQCLQPLWDWENVLFVVNSIF